MNKEHVNKWTTILRLMKHTSVTPRSQTYQHVDIYQHVAIQPSSTTIFQNEHTVIFPTCACALLSSLCSADQRRGVQHSNLLWENVCLQYSSSSTVKSLSLASSKLFIFAVFKTSAIPVI